MDTQPPAASPDFPSFTHQTAATWDKLADWWDEKIGDGNAYQDLLIEPTQNRLLAIKPGEEVLDIACGAGRFTRRMARQGATVFAFDHSRNFIERARKRTSGSDGRISYSVMSATDPASLLSLGERRFDAAVCTMAIMDMAEITPLASTLPRLLKPGGRFVWSITHPVFNSGNARLNVEDEDREGRLVTTFSVRVSDYLIARQVMGLGIVGQPVPQHYFHRPLAMLVNTFSDHGFALDRLEEVALPPGTTPTVARPLSRANFTAIPQILVARMRLV